MLERYSNLIYFLGKERYSKLHINFYNDPK